MIYMDVLLHLKDLPRDCKELELLMGSKKKDFSISWDKRLLKFNKCVCIYLSCCGVPTFSDYLYNNTVRVDNIEPDAMKFMTIEDSRYMISAYYSYLEQIFYPPQSFTACAPVSCVNPNGCTIL
jgi:hypothetical protein